MLHTLKENTTFRLHSLSSDSHIIQTTSEQVIIASR